MGFQNNLLYLFGVQPCEIFLRPSIIKTRVLYQTSAHNPSQICFWVLNLLLHTPPLERSKNWKKFFQERYFGKYRVPNGVIIDTPVLVNSSFSLHLPALELLPSCLSFTTRYDIYVGHHHQRFGFFLMFFLYSINYWKANLYERVSASPLVKVLDWFSLISLQLDTYAKAIIVVDDRYFGTCL